MVISLMFTNVTLLCSFISVQMIVNVNKREPTVPTMMHCSNLNVSVSFTAPFLYFL